MAPTCFWKKNQIPSELAEKSPFGIQKIPFLLSTFYVAISKTIKLVTTFLKVQYLYFFPFLQKQFSIILNVPRFSIHPSRRDVEISYAQSKPWQTIQIQNPRIHNPKPKLQIPKSKLKNPKSNLKSKGAKKNKLIQNPRSKMNFFFPCCTHHDDSTVRDSVNYGTTCWSTQ